ncbi:TOTE conflict system archaeo-eukaryotic primase domain-containing protein [Ohtaekwangia sp.]|uniref:TOTE conflict system archaeo-eukaryotic primase domain-containing protein n=1 Tax=Ohtaekwangia sp. TaxID=2066019 RepID=UPI002FDDCC25
MIDVEQIKLFRFLFNGREDAFAIRWEKGNKSGYMPSYQFDPYHYRIHKAKGGTLANYAHKTLQPLTDEQVKRHLLGEQLIGIYPLLLNNTSHFIAADFDGDNWPEEARKFIQACEAANLPVYLERSRSGNGGHVWLFFSEAYPAFKSRKIFLSLLQATGIFSVFDKDSSFDRLFPNQDSLSGKGLGNLIALPLFKKSIDQGNSCFVNPATTKVYPDQWQFLKDIKRVNATQLDKLLGSSAPSIEMKTSGTLTIRLSNKVVLNRNAVPLTLINFIKEELNFTSSEFLIKKKLGKNTWGVARNFKLVEEEGNQVFIPRGFIGKLLRFCKDQNIANNFLDEREKKGRVKFTAHISLKAHQEDALNQSTKKDFGVIVAPPGSGKTVLGLAIIAEKAQPALIVVHRKQLADQWIERTESFLKIPRKDIGKIAGGKIQSGKLISVAMIQSLTKVLASEDGQALCQQFGTIIIDECHHVPAETYRSVISKLHSFYMYGLTATPFRKYNDGKLIFTYIGDLVAEIRGSQVENQPKAKIVIRNTALSIPFDSKTDKFETLSKVLVHDSTRNKIIIEDVMTELNQGKKVVLISERKEHIDTLNLYLKQFYETVTLSGDDSEQSKSLKWKLLKDGNFQALITTGQYFGEGSDLSSISSVFLVYPFSFEGKLIQYIGRVQRSEIAPTIYDYRDSKIQYLEVLFQKRDIYYKKLYSEGILFEREVERGPQAYETVAKIPLEQLLFKFGIVAFKYKVPQITTEAQFEVENKEMRPEFEVLKPYFAKFLKVKSIRVNISYKIEFDKIKSYIAFSEDLDKINKELVEAVKFRFVTKTLIGRIPDLNSDNLLDVQQLQESSSSIDNSLYKSGEELIDEILKMKDAKHYEQLRYLAGKHDRSVLRVRFVLLPFSFVFLLTGDQQYHIIWETLDTEEATYIWNVEKHKATLKSKLKEIEQDLGFIRSNGRQAFIDKPRENFSRIIHDYSELKKGFILWKDQLQSRLV